MSNTWDPHVTDPVLWKLSAILPKLFGSISIVSSSMILTDVLLKWKYKQKISLPLFIVVCISVSDLLYSFFSAFLSTWMVGYDSGAYLAAGNTATCTAQGFIVSFSIGASSAYYAALAILFWLPIGKGWKEEKLKRKKVKLSFLLPPAVIAFGLSIPPFFSKAYNYGRSFTCFITPKPFLCNIDPDVTCERGGNSEYYRLTFYIYILSCNFVILVFMALLVHAVLTQERRMDRYRFSADGEQRKQRENTIKSAWQGLRYVGAFTAAYLPAYIFIGYKVNNQPPPDLVYYIHIILTPLLGFFNSLVYFRPRYLSLREKGHSRRDAFMKVHNIHFTRATQCLNGVVDADAQLNRDVTKPLDDQTGTDNHITESPAV